VYLTRPLMIVGRPADGRDIHRCISRAASSSIPILAALPLHGDAGRIANLDPCAGRAGSIGTVNPLGNDALVAKPARVPEDDRAVLDNVVVEQDARLGITQQPRQRGLAVGDRTTGRPACRDDPRFQRAHSDDQ
jgi:hypothetical protein